MALPLLSRAPRDPDDPPRHRLPIGAIVLDKDRKERVAVLLPEDTPLPCERTVRFAYAYQGMTAVRLELTVGPGQTREEVRVFGRLELTGLPPQARGTPIEVTLDHRG